ncbi:integrase [Pseudomonas sichuanensis]|uniref:tyrosine-type recombinase/integrase n=1 Tax=Pseudomonas sichuanensis TaxID=2213015 RepID=UPI002447C1C1|nr:integrase [Pseudomonas sichuanensis]MDH0730270.1 integrase [Pseudomonas sichuanensis]MDH1582344.1 integrase [Pseudomonas sichuanensis]MDH1591741.1 integrase [Pseudomonas sichuanensis]MDH1599538.1 integrase [Pseudomonas sichuanensis]
MSTKDDGKAGKTGILKAIQITNMSTGTLSERLQGLPGTIYFERRDNGVIEAYLRYTPRGGSRRKRKIGTFSASGKGGLTLNQIRVEAGELAKLAKEHGDLEEYFALVAENTARAKKEAERLKAIADARSSFTDLFRDYISDRIADDVSPQQIKEFENVLRRDLIESFPHIMDMKAADVEPDHIEEILDKIWDRGSLRQCEKVRSFLHAAFNFGLKKEHKVGRKSKRRYHLKSNPVSSVTMDSQKNPRKRALSEAELKQLWNTIDKSKGVGPIVAAAFKFLIATGGQRIEQVMRQTWDSYDEKEGTFTIIDKKGRARPKVSRARVSIVPLTDRAVAILDFVRTQNLPDCNLPFTTNGETKIHSSTFSSALKKWFKTEHARIDGAIIPEFTPSDLRRSMTQVMQRACIANEGSDLLQSHGIDGVVAKHYRNNPHAALPKNRQTMAFLEIELSRILDSNER